MVETKTGIGNWIKNNVAAIVVPLVSGGIALVISYGTNVQEETNLLNRITALESAKTELVADIEELDDTIDDLEDTISDHVRNLQTSISNGTRDVENMVIREGRELERSFIRMESRVDNLSRRMALFDGIGAPSSTTFGPMPNFSLESADDMLLPDVENFSVEPGE